MNDLLINPVYNALITKDTHLGDGTDHVRYFYEDVAPFAGFENGYARGFEELYEILPADRKIVYAIPEILPEPKGWEYKFEILGLQFIYPEDRIPEKPRLSPTKLGNEHIEEMIALTALTRPGPFVKRTIEFGHYHGFFEAGKLVAMAGQRMHINEYTEISAVCTHPNYLGKGYAAALLQHQLAFILESGQKPFLHVRDDNHRAIAVYERLGFKVNRPMNFYFMKKRTLLP